ncbi:hypothetical protein ACHAWF_005251, partial [Thalassiosira exigua]
MTTGPSRPTFIAEGSLNRARSLGKFPGHKGERVPSGNGSPGAAAARLAKTADALARRQERFGETAPSNSRCHIKVMPYLELNGGHSWSPPLETHPFSRGRSYLVVGAVFVPAGAYGLSGSIPPDTFAAAGLR